MNVVVAVGDRALGRDLAACVRAAGYGARESRDPETLAGADVVVMDADGPDDRAAIAALRRRAPALRIVAVGSDAGARVGIAARRHGADEFVRMPFDVETLERALGPGDPATGGTGGDAGFTTVEPAVLRLLERAERAAQSDATLVLRGESGTGKSALARTIHRWSPRRIGPLVTVACAGLSGADAEAELFGDGARAGRLVAAAGGTLVLEDVGELPAAVQPRLLDWLQQRALAAPSGNRGPAPDVRIVATTRQDLAASVREGRLGEALRLRLGVIELVIPPLRERPADVAMLAGRLATQLARQLGSEPPRLGEALHDALRRHPLEGNVRELQSLMQRAALLFPGEEVDADRLLSARPPLPATAAGLPTFDLKALEREAIAQCLAQRGGNRTHASRDLGISIRTLRNKIRQYGLT